MASARQEPVAQRESYRLRYLPRASIVVDGILNEDDWQKADRHTRFAFPWRSVAPPRTEFRALCDDTHFYFIFRVEDRDIVLQDPFTGEDDVAKEDRVELFFAADAGCKRYWGFEIDPLGRVLDYQAAYYRKLDFSWSCKGIKTVGKINPRGYVVEGAIPLTTLRALGLPELKPGNQLHVGLYRAEFSHKKDGGIDEGWLSWIDPKTPEPDFHVPASFGRFRVVDASTH